MAAGSLLVAVNRKIFISRVEKSDADHVSNGFGRGVVGKRKQMLTDTIREHYENNQPLNEMLHEEAMQEFYHYCIVGECRQRWKLTLQKTVL